MEPALDRRQFLTLAGGAWFAMHSDGFGGANPVAGSHADGVPRHSAPKTPLLRKLKLETAVPLGAMRRYYEGSLGLKVLEQAEGSLTLAAGPSEIQFVKSRRASDGPFYHFAFNIPEGVSTNRGAGQRWTRSHRLA